MKLSDVITRVEEFNNEGPPSCRNCYKLAPVELTARMGGEEGDELVVGWIGNMRGWSYCSGEGRTYHLCPECRK